MLKDITTNVVWIGFSEYSQDEVNALADAMTSPYGTWPIDILHLPFTVQPTLVGQPNSDESRIFDIYLDTSTTCSYKKIPLKLLAEALVDFSKVTEVDLLLATESAGIVSQCHSRTYYAALKLLVDYIRDNDLKVIEIMDTDRRLYGGEDEMYPITDDTDDHVDLLLTSTWVITVMRNQEGTDDD